MSKYSYVATREEIENSFMANPLNNFEGYFCAWKSKADVLQNLLPPPLKLDSDIVKLYLCKIQNPTRQPWYREANLLLSCRFDDIPGYFTVSFLLEGPGAETGTHSGRENFFMPKKKADKFTIQKIGPMGSAAIERNGMEIVNLKADINGKYNSPECDSCFAGFAPGSTQPLNTFFLFYDIENNGGKRSYKNGRIVLGSNQMVFKKWEPATIDITLGDSVNDPWAELEVVKPLGGAYVLFDIVMGSGKVMGSVDTIEAIRRTYKSRYDCSTYGCHTQIL